MCDFGVLYNSVNKKTISRLCEGDINVDVITNNGDVTSGTSKVKVIPGMKQNLFSFTQVMLGGWSMQGGQTKQGELFIALTHEDHKPATMYSFSLVFASKYALPISAPQTSRLFSLARNITNLRDLIETTPE